MRVPLICTLCAALLLLATGPAWGEAPTREQLQAAAKKAGTVNGLCPVNRRLVVSAAGTATYKGEKIGFSHKDAVTAFVADPTRYMDRLRLNPPKYWYVTKTTSVADMRKAKATFQCANGACPLTGTAIIARGGTTTYKGQKIGFCCPGCRGKFLKNPDKYMKALRADPLAYAYDRPGPTNAQMRVARSTHKTANGKCPVMGKLVIAKGGSVTYQGQRIGFCCPPCIARFNKDPEKYMRRMRAEPESYGYTPPKR